MTSTTSRPAKQMALPHRPAPIFRANRKSPSHRTNTKSEGDAAAIDGYLPSTVFIDGDILLLLLFVVAAEGRVP